MSANTGAFFEDIWRQIPVAESAAGTLVQKWFEVAGLILELRFLGSALEPYILPAFGHLEIGEPKKPTDLVLYCWDCASLAIEFPRSPVAPEAFTPRGEILGLNDHRFQTSFDTDGRQLSVFDARLRRAVYCVGNAAAIPHYQYAEPIRAILSWFVREHDRQLIHAAAVGEPEGGVLLIGRSGAGKSNTALGCVVSSLRYAADDFCAVSAGNNPMVYSVYCSGKTHVADWSRHGFLSALEPKFGPPGEKAIYFLHRKLRHKIISEFPLKAILLPRQGGTACELHAISPVTALCLAGPSTAVLLPNAGAEVMRCIARLVRKVPCYELLLGSAPQKIPDTISALLTSRLSHAKSSPSEYSLFRAAAT